MKLKDYILIALLGIVSFAVGMVGGMAAHIFGTVGVFIHSAIGALLNAPIFMVMCKKVEKRGMILAYYTVLGIVYLVMGFFPMIFIVLAAGIAGELIILGKEGPGDVRRLGLAYVVAQFINALHGFIFLLVFGVKGLAETFPKLFTLERAQRAWDRLMNPVNLSIILSIQVVLSVVGVFFGIYIYRKFFDKSAKKEGILA